MLTARVPGSIEAAEEAVLKSAAGGEVEEVGLCEELGKDECRSCGCRDVKFDYPVSYPIISTATILWVST